MTTAPLLALTAVAAYLTGAIPFGYLVARVRGVNIFEHGSGNIGATNVGRVLGRKFGLLVFALDFLKGAVPVAAARLLAPQVDAGVTGEELGVVAGLAAVLGHMFPAYLRFRGGKGVATAAGVVVVLVPVAALAGLLVWAAAVSATGYVSAGSLAAAAALCAVRLAQTAPAPFAPEHRVVTLFCLVAAALVIVRHRGNVGRLLAGTENRLKETGTMQHLSRVLHVLALGLWFGTAVFFSLIAAVALFDTFETLGANVAGRPDWFPLATPYDKVTPEIDGPKEQGSRVAGAAVSPMFDIYFPLSGVCGFLAVATAWRWQYRQPRRRVHGWRVAVLLLALTTVVAGWPLERYVSDLRGPRNERVAAYLAGGGDVEQLKTAALAARREFGLWHVASLFLNFGTIGLVTVGMALAAYLPPVEREPEASGSGGTSPAG